MLLVLVGPDSAADATSATVTQPRLTQSTDSFQWRKSSAGLSTDMQLTRQQALQATTSTKEPSPMAETKTANKDVR
jgi:hypothetical protein